MHQVLFHIPILTNFFPPDGIPIYGFGAMLFLAFISVVLWGTVRAGAVGMQPTRFQDFVIWLFIAGIIGARTLYMIQYSKDFPDSILGILGSFFKIWEGGIIFYGGALGGVIGYGLFYAFIMRRLQISGWQLADAVAPLLALGLAIGRIGCYLNGCCWGQVACEPNATVPLGSAHFPLLPAHARAQLVDKEDLQTSTGFSIFPRERFKRQTDPRSTVEFVEPDSPAGRAGLQPGDRIIKVNGQPNAIYVDLFGSDAIVESAVAAMKKAGGRLRNAPDGRTSMSFNSLESYYRGEEAALAEAPMIDLVTPPYPDYPDYFNELAREWPRGKSTLTLAVDRQGNEVTLSFVPLTIGLYPTQIYETVSMLLLILVLLAYYPYRHHDGELMVIVMLGYSIHRFINESLRIEPAVGWGLTLSQWGSVLIFVAAVVMEIYLLCVMPSRWRRTPPGQTGTAPPAPSVAPASPAPVAQPAS